MSHRKCRRNAECGSSSSAFPLPPLQQAGFLRPTASSLQKTRAPTRLPPVATLRHPPVLRSVVPSSSVTSSVNVPTTADTTSTTTRRVQVSWHPTSEGTLGSVVYTREEYTRVEQHSKDPCRDTKPPRCCHHPSASSVSTSSMSPQSGSSKESFLLSQLDSLSSSADRLTPSSVRLPPFSSSLKAPTLTSKYPNVIPPIQRRDKVDTGKLIVDENQVPASILQYLQPKLSCVANSVSGNTSRSLSLSLFLSLLSSLDVMKWLCRLHLSLVSLRLAYR
ncbi:hypothetical protein B566_EDAN000972 [Ephemera danica]|nr:hypothetical protein B566_EDAN000972 [Ephemera danica]